MDENQSNTTIKSKRGRKKKVVVEETPVDETILQENSPESIQSEETTEEVNQTEETTEEVNQTQEVIQTEETTEEVNQTQEVIQTEETSEEVNQTQEVIQTEETTEEVNQTEETIEVVNQTEETTEEVNQTEVDNQTEETIEEVKQTEVVNKTEETIEEVKQTEEGKIEENTENNIKFCKSSDKKKQYNVKIQHLEHDASKYLKFNLDDGLPDTIDLSKNMDYIYNQYDLGSCTANSLAWAFRYKQGSKINPSRIFIYYNERFLDFKEGDNDVSIDDGSTLQQGITVLKKYGVCDEKYCPYIIDDFAKKPSHEAYVNAELNQIIDYGIVPQDLYSMKKCLAEGNPFVFGIYVFDSFDYVGNNGIVPDPNTQTESILGGHALIAVGYDDNTQMFKFANSYGRSWGDNGYGYISYNYLTNRDITDDLWTIYTTENGGVPDSPKNNNSNNSNNRKNKRKGKGKKGGSGAKGGRKAKSGKNKKNGKK